MADKEKLGSNPPETWGYYQRLQPGHERDAVSEDWFIAGEIGNVRFKDTESLKKMHQYLDAFNKTLLESPDDMRYEFVAVPTRTKMTPQTETDEEDLILLIQPISDDVTLNDLREFTGRVKGSEEQ